MLCTHLFCAFAYSEVQSGDLYSSRNQASLEPSGLCTMKLRSIKVASPSFISAMNSHSPLPFFRAVSAATAVTAPQSTDNTITSYRIRFCIVSHSSFLISLLKLQLTGIQFRRKSFFFKRSAVLAKRRRFTADGMRNLSLDSLIFSFLPSTSQTYPLVQPFVVWISQLLRQFFGLAVQAMQHLLEISTNYFQPDNRSAFMESADSKFAQALAAFESRVRSFDRGASVGGFLSAACFEFGSGFIGQQPFLTNPNHGLLLLQFDGALFPARAAFANFSVKVSAQDVALLVKGTATRGLFFRASPYSLPLVDLKPIKRHFGGIRLFTGHRANMQVHLFSRASSSTLSP